MTGSLLSSRQQQQLCAQATMLHHIASPHRCGTSRCSVHEVSRSFSCLIIFLLYVNCCVQYYCCFGFRSTSRVVVVVPHRTHKQQHHGTSTWNRQGLIGRFDGALSGSSTRLWGILPKRIFNRRGGDASAPNVVDDENDDTNTNDKDTISMKNGKMKNNSEDATVEDEDRQQQQQKKQQGSRKKRRRNTSSSSIIVERIGSCLGSGSYGTVHLLELRMNDDEDKDARGGDGGDDSIAKKKKDVISLVGKRPWTAAELQSRAQNNDGDNYDDDDDDDKATREFGAETVEVVKDDKYWIERERRCVAYWEVERHCFEQLSSLVEGKNRDGRRRKRRNTEQLLLQLQEQKHPGLPSYRGIASDSSGRLWMLFEPLVGAAGAVFDFDDDTVPLSVSDKNNINTPISISTTTTSVTTASSEQQEEQFDSSSLSVAPTLDEFMRRDRIDHRQNKNHHLFHLGRALLGVLDERTSSEKPKQHDEIVFDDEDQDDESHTLTETLDVVITQILEVLAHVHSRNIVHRDLKPSNFLVAAPLPSSYDSLQEAGAENQSTSQGRLVLIDFGSAADLNTAGMFKANIGLGDRVAISPIYAAPEVFIDSSSTAPLNFDCFSAALLICQLLFQYLEERKESGFHQQLEASSWSLENWLYAIMLGKVQPIGLSDAMDVLRDRPGLFRLLDRMLVPDPRDRLSSERALQIWKKILNNGKHRLDSTTATDQDNKDLDIYDGPFVQSVLDTTDFCLVPNVLPLDFVATFSRDEPLGLVLAEADNTVGDTAEIETDMEKWQQAVQNARPGDVFIQSIVPGGQADIMGIFEVGDRLNGVGEIPVAEGGFEKVVEMLRNQPLKAKYVTLHFDRSSASFVESVDAAIPVPPLEGPIQVIDQGVWSVKGRRSTQEDAFILHDVHDAKERSILLAGVFDGHLGDVASKFASEDFPVTVSEELLRMDGASVASLIERSWDRTCDAYRSTCMQDDESCLAEYDPVEGTLSANTGSDDAAAGTTAAIVALDKQTSQLAVLNCGDSRALVVDGLRRILFKTTDHTPEAEAERLLEGQQQGLDYGTPVCSFSQWSLPVGEYAYALARSLEGPFATSKGIVSTPDVDVIQTMPGTTVLVATDGLWEVMDTAEVANMVVKLRNENVSSRDAAAFLCSRALEKGTFDNVSVVILYLD